MLDEMGVTPQEVDSLAREETVQLFRENPLDWTETEIVELLESASLTSTNNGGSPSWERIVVVEISERGDGLYWLDGQGDLAAPGDDLFWVALDANADPEHNLALLSEVKKHSLEPRFAAEIEKKIEEYEDLK
jgi:hypothetical protein